MQAPSLDATYLRFLVKAGEILGASLDYHETLRNVCGAAVETVADICILDLKNESGATDLVAAAHRDRSREGALRRAGRFLRSEKGRAVHPVWLVLSSGEAHCAATVDEAYIAANATSDEHAVFMLEMHYRSIIIVPVISTVQGTLGTLTLVRTTPGAPPYDDEALFFAEDLGRRCGTAISKAMLYSQTVEAATRLQMAALPRALPFADSVTFDAYYEPAESQWLVGGDWYDAFALPSGRFGISIGDISGHGIEVAALMLGLRDAIRVLLHAGVSPAETLVEADRLVTAEFPEGKYATAIVAVYDPRKRTLACVAAGHPGPLIWSEATQTVVDPFQERGLPLGLRSMCPPVRDVDEREIAPGSLALFFTDGLAEARRDYLLGERAIKHALSNSAIREAERPARAIRDAVVRGAHADDIALLTLKVTR